MEQALTFKDPAGHAVSGILAAPPNGSDRLAVLCHGFLSNKNSHTNKTLTELLFPQDIATFRFDFFGQGGIELWGVGGASRRRQMAQALMPGAQVPRAGFSGDAPVGVRRDRDGPMEV